jgi:hypothetical protein
MLSERNPRLKHELFFLYLLAYMVAVAEHTYLYLMLSTASCFNAFYSICLPDHSSPPFFFLRYRTHMQPLGKLP